MISCAETSEQGWQAELALRFEARPQKTVMAGRKQYGPLAVQRPFYPEKDVCHIYLLHPPGGVVGGDALLIDVSCESNSSTLITTPGATKFYRSNQRWAKQQQRLTVKAGASLEWFPQESIFFPGALGQLATEVNLEADAKFIAWELNCLGRPSCNERFDHGQALFSLKLLRDGIPLFIDQLSIENPLALDHISGLRSCAVNATMVATGISDKTLEDLHRQFSTTEQSTVGFTLLDDLLVCRFLGNSTEEARNLFTKIWQTVRPQSLNRAACLPRIWST